MLKTIRYKLGVKLLQMAHEQIEKGDFDSIIRGLRYTKSAVAIVPNCKELQEFGNGMEITIKIKTQTEKIES